MKKNKGYIFIEALVILGLTSLVILPLVVLMNKNINRISYLNHERELRKLTCSLEVIFNKIVDKNKSNKYTLEKSKEKNNDFLLKENQKIITTLKSIKIDSDAKIFVEKKEVKSMGKKVGEIFSMKVKVRNRTIERILVIL